MITSGHVTKIVTHTYNALHELESHRVCGSQYKRFDLQQPAEVLCEQLSSHRWSVIIDHPRSDGIYNFEGVCQSVCLSVCLSVCMYDVYQTITFENLDVPVGSSFSHIRYVISREYRSSSYMVRSIEVRQRGAQKRKTAVFPLKSHFARRKSVRKCLCDTKL